MEKKQVLVAEFVKKMQTVNENAKKGIDLAGETKSAFEKLRADITGRMDKIETEAKKAGARGEGESITFASELKKAIGGENAKHLLALKSGESQAANFEIKAPVTMLFSNVVTGKPSIDLRPNIIELARRKTHVREMIPQSSTDKHILQIVKETAQEGAAGMQTEGNAKAQISTTLAVTDYNVRTIAAFTKISKDMLDDVSGMTAYLSSILPTEILKLEDVQLLTGTGVAPNIFGLAQNAVLPAAWNLGTPVQDPQFWDVLARTIGFQLSANHDVNGILLNPVDFYTMLTAKGANGQYVSPLLLDGGQAFLYGVPVFINTAVAAGKFFLGDWSKSSIFQREGLNVRFFEQDDDNVQKNLITVRAEERITHAIYQDKAYVFGDFADGVDDLTIPAV